MAYKYLYNALSGQFDLVNASSGTPAAPDTSVQYNNGGAFGGDSGLTYTQGTGTLNATNVNVTTNITWDSTQAKVTASTGNFKFYVGNQDTVDITYNAISGTRRLELNVANLETVPGLVATYDNNTGFYWPNDATPNIALSVNGQNSTFWGETETVFNESSHDKDFRVESDALTHMLFVDAGVSGVGVGVSSPTARLHLMAGTATANTAPLKFDSGTNLTAPENGAMEYNGSHLYITIGGVRYQLDQQSSSATPSFVNTFLLMGA